MVLGAAMVAGSTDFMDFSWRTVSSFLPLITGAAGITNFHLWYFSSQVGDNGDPQKALNTGEFVSSGLVIAASYYIINKFLPETWTFAGTLLPLNGRILGNNYWSCRCAVGIITEHYTGTKEKSRLSRL